MGQAKLKGSFQQRQAQAIAQARTQFPQSITCNNCSHELTDIQPMDVRGIPGMRLAGGAICTSCSHKTWVLDGTPEALAQMQEFMDQENGETAKMGFEKKPVFPV
jgi:hypothetical protein